MLALAGLLWYPHIKSEIVAQAQSCKNCIEKGKNLKTILPENNLGTLNFLTEPNKEVQMNFTGPIPFKNNTINNIILITVDRLSRLHHAETYNNSPTQTPTPYHATGPTIQVSETQTAKTAKTYPSHKQKRIKIHYVRYIHPKFTSH